MKIKYSALVSATSGKLNGSVAASNRGGAYIRNKGVTSNPQTIDQQANRSMFGSISSQFRSLTSAQITAWNNAAQDFPVIDRFGDTRYLSGLALFVQLNKNLADIGAPGIVNPPAKQAFPAIFAIGASYDISDGFEIDVSTDATTLADFVAVVRCTPPLSKSVLFVKNKLRRIGQKAGEVGGNITYSATADYNAKFGAPAIGQDLVVQVVLVSKVSGEMSVLFNERTTVVA